MTDAADHDRLRALPSVDRVLVELNAPREGSPLFTAAARRAIDRARERVRAGDEAPSTQAVVAEARKLLDEQGRESLARVINATGVLIHTNLGRVPLGHRQIEAITAVASGYTNLEYDVASGTRGDRYAHARRALAALTGAESAVVVNNNAAAVLLVLAALAEGGEVIISRGELVEIGGEFRIPDVMGVSGARLVEVGTTNRTHLADYERAITDRTAAILKVHPSNYRMIGFTADVPPRELAKLTRGRKLWFIHDVGSGLIGQGRTDEWLRGEPVIQDALAEGADVVTFSGDKLFGGPQAGIVVGRARAIEKVSRHPLLRALRPDKMTLAAVEATAAAYLEGEGPRLPLWSMALASTDELRDRADRIAASIRTRTEGVGAVETIRSMAVAGGGSVPGAEIASWAVALSHPERSPDEIARSLRYGKPAVIARIEDDRVLLDVRTVPPDEDETVVEAAAGALSAPA